jgi:hypothetical protein
MNNTTNIETLKANAEAAAVALREAQEVAAAAERAARQAEQEAKREVERAAAAKKEEELNLKLEVAFAPVRDAIGNSSQNLITKTHRFAIDLVNGVQVSFGRETRSSGSYSRHSTDIDTGRTVVSVGYQYAYGADACTKRFPSKKDGTFNIDKITEHMNELIVRKDIAKATAAKEAAAKAEAGNLAKVLQAEFGVTDATVKGSMEHYRMATQTRREYYTVSAPAGKVFITLGTKTLNAAQARLLLSTLAGIKGQLETLAD